MCRIGSHAYSLLEKEGLFSSGLILEAPFTKMSDEIREYPLTKVKYYCCNNHLNLKKNKSQYILY